MGKSNSQKIGKVFIIILAVIVVLGFVKNQILKTVITVGTSKVTDAPVHIGSFSLGILTQDVSIKGFKIYNPKGFPDGVLIDFDEISVKCDVPALLTGKLHVLLITVNMNELIVIKNKEGQLNVDSFAFVKDSQASKGIQKTEKKKPAPEIAMQIDKLFLNVGRVVYKDYSQGDEPVVQVFDVGINNQVYENITSAQQLAAVVTASALKSTAIKSAGIYGAATILGAGFLPAGVAGVLIGKDHSEQVFRKTYDQVYAACLAVLEEKGEVTTQNKPGGVLKAKVDGMDVAANMEETGRNETKVTVSARKFLIPKPELAGGILYRVEQKLK